MHHMFSVGLDVDKFVFTELHLIFKIYFEDLIYSIKYLQGKILNIFFKDEWEKILLYAGNSCLSNPLVFITLGKIYLKNLFIKIPGQSAGNFNISTKATASAKNTYNSFINLPKISEHVPLHKSNLKDKDFGFFLAGLIEGDG